MAPGSPFALAEATHAAFVVRPKESPLKRLRPGPWLLVLAAALVVPALAALPASALTSAELRDVPPNHWSYKAIQQLVDRYGVMGGFPDATFRGDKNLTRYELAAALLKVMQRIDAAAVGRAPAPVPGRPPAAPLSVSPTDQAALKALRTEFANELARMDEQLQKHDELLKTLEGKLKNVSNVKVGGSINTMFADETLDVGKDRSAPYMTTGFGLSLSGDLSATSRFSASLGGTLKASGAGDRPGVLGGGPGAVDNMIRLNGASYTSKIGATTLNLGRIGMSDVGSALDFKTGNFFVGVGEVGPNASQLRSGGDVGAGVSSEIGPVKVFGGLNSNILLSTLEFSAGPLRLAGGYETDHAAITQNLLNPSAGRVRTTDNAALVVDLGGEGAFGATIQANATNLSLTQYGGGVRAGLGGLDLNVMGMFVSPPDQSVTVLSFGGLLNVPGRHLFGPVSLPDTLIAAMDNYTISAPPRADNQPTTGPGGQALGKNAGVSVQVSLENPLVPNLVAEYNIQAKLIENIFVPNAADPITSESFLFRSSIGF